MKEVVDYYEDSETNNRGSKYKILIAKQAFAKQNRNMKRMHSNSILNEMRLNQKINQEKLLLQQEKSLNRFSTSRHSSFALIQSKKKLSDFNINLKIGSPFHKQRLSQFFQTGSNDVIPQINSYNFSDINDFLKRLDQTDFNKKKSKDQKQFLISSPKKKTKNLQKKPRNLVLSSINTKLRQIDIISKKFDKVNSFLAIDSDFAHHKYSKKCDLTSKILKQFESKLNLRKNKVNERRNSLKKHSKMDYRYKVQPKRYQTEYSQKQNLELQNDFQGLWKQNARQIKNYITGGYTDEKEDYSDFCDIEEYKRVKNNFKTFQQIYNNIKQDKDNPIGKVCKTDFKKPNILEVVSIMEKQHQIIASKLS